MTTSAGDQWRVGRRAFTGLVVALMSVLFGCTSTDTPSPSVSSVATATPQATQGIDAVTFPHHNLGPNEPGWEGLAVGSLSLDDGCLWIVSDLGGGPYVALWPPQYRLVQIVPAVIDPGGGGAPLTEGEHVTFFGGQLDAIEQADILEGLLGDTPSPDCGSSNLFVVTGYERP